MVRAIQHRLDTLGCSFTSCRIEEVYDTWLAIASEAVYQQNPHCNGAPLLRGASPQQESSAQQVRCARIWIPLEGGRHRG
jgi:hypothetical protein